ncbi:MAG: oxidoreductase [Elusimicrobia bacterium]|nr:oxidoreductase [Elusimicrobiota bacterium]
MPAALLAGATGLVGGECLRLLLESPAYSRVYAPARRALPPHPKLSALPAELAAPLPLDLAGGHVFCALGTTYRKAGSAEAFRAVDYGLVLALARAAADRGAARFLLVSSSGADAASRFLYPRVKGEAERAVAVLPFEAVSILRPSLLLGPRAEPRPAEAVGRALAPLLALLLVGPLRRWRPIEASVVARAMLTLAAADDRGARIVESDELQALGG